MSEQTAQVPMRSVGPVKLCGPIVADELMLPLATFESPLWPSVARGARISRKTAGISAVLCDERMTRSILLESDSAQNALNASSSIKNRVHDVQIMVETTSRFARLLDINTQIVGSLLYIRLEFETGDAAGHNMSTKAAEAVMTWALKEYPYLKYVSISGNYCTDKKVSAVNGILGRGKYVVAEMVVPSEICRKYLRASPEDIVAINTRKNLLGSIVAGSLRSANAHYANMLLAFYLATGQDAANIVEGSQGITYAELRDNDLYFSVTIPNLIVGTIGNGKDIGFVAENLRSLGCLNDRAPGENSRRLAVAAAAAVLCGELSLLAAQTNQGELMRAHQDLERH